MFSIMLWKDLGNVYFNVAVLSPSDNLTDVVEELECALFVS